MFKWFKEQNLTLEGSSFSTEGFIKLKPLFKTLAEKYNVNYIEKGKL